MQVSAGKTYEHAGQLIPDLQALKDQRLDISHTITSLSFGESGYPGQVNPLSGASFDQRKKTSINPNGLPGDSPWFSLSSLQPLLMHVFLPLRKKSLLFEPVVS
jgi:hypothetical protein